MMAGAGQLPRPLETRGVEGRDRGALPFEHFAENPFFWYSMI